MHWITHPVRLKGETVELVPLEKTHFPELSAVAKNKAIWQHYFFDGSDDTLLLPALEEALTEREAGRQYPFAIIRRSDGKIIGSTRFTDIQARHKKLEIGWTWLHPDYWGTTVNPECKLLLLQFCFNTLGTFRVQLKTDELNIRSRKAIEKIGGQFEGVLRHDMLRYNGTHRNSAYYSITNNEWETVEPKLKQMANPKQVDRNTIIYRQATHTDIPQLQQLGVCSYGSFEHVLSAEHWNKMKASLGSEKTYTELLDISTGFICEYEGRLIGMAFLVPHGNPTKIFETDWAYIRLLGVHPDFRGLGIARTLMMQCIDLAAQKHESILALHTSEFMNTARHLYEDLGFKRLREIEPVYEKTYWIYTLNINQSNISNTKYYH